MKEKRVLAIAILLFLLVMPFALADETEQVEKAYTCLKDKLGDNCGDTQTTKEAAFNLLAMAYDSSINSDCQTSLKDKERDNCWGKTSTSACDIKSTALAILALDYAGVNVEDYVDWLLEQETDVEGMEWFLEIDATNRTECEVNSDDFVILDNKKLSGENPDGLIKAYDNYWFEIKEMDKNYTISCNKDFITTLLYKKEGASIYYVSSDIHSASAEDSTTERVNSYCFSTSSECDYEGSLWAVLALSSLGKDVSDYLPYISLMSDESENLKYLPSAFLYMLTNDDEYYSDLISQQKQGKYWEKSGNKFYDTALGLLALSDKEPSSKIKEYLLTLQNSDGCWQSDTSFILHSGWPKASSSGGGDGSSVSCTGFNHYCVNSGECPIIEVLDNFECPSASKICCNVAPELETCLEKQGVICDENEYCDGDEALAEDTSNCCIGSCEPLSVSNECEDSGYSCQTSCSSSQEEISTLSDNCDLGVCCKDKESKFSWWLIILLIILIIILIIVIIFRKRIKLWFFKSKNSSQSKPYSGRPQQIMPRAPMMRPGQMLPSRNPRAPLRKPVSKDKDFDETMRKLREMSG